MLEFENHEPVFRTEHLGDRDTIRVVGEVDMSSAPQLRELIRKMPSANMLVVDLSECTYLDSSVISVLTQTHRSRGERLIVVVPLAARIRKIFEITGLDRALDIRADLDGEARRRPA